MQDDSFHPNQETEDQETEGQDELATDHSSENDLVPSPVEVAATSPHLETKAPAGEASTTPLPAPIHPIADRAPEERPLEHQDVSPPAKPEEQEPVIYTPKNRGFHRTRNAPSFRVNYSIAVALILFIPLSLAGLATVIPYIAEDPPNETSASQSLVFLSIQKQLRKAEAELAQAHRNALQATAREKSLILNRDLEKLSSELKKQRRIAGLPLYSQNVSEPIWTMGELLVWAKQLDISFNRDRFLISKNGQFRSPDNANINFWIEQSIQTMGQQDRQASDSTSKLKATEVISSCLHKEGLCLVENIHLETPTNQISRAQIITDVSRQTIQHRSLVQQREDIIDFQMALLIGAFLLGLLLLSMFLRHIFKCIVSPIDALENRIRIFANGTPIPRDDRIYRTAEFSRCEDAIDGIQHLLNSQKKIRDRYHHLKDSVQQMATEVSSFGLGEKKKRLSVQGETEQQMLAHSINRFLDSLSAQIILLQSHSVAIKNIGSMMQKSPSQQNAGGQLKGLTKKLEALSPLSNLLQETSERMETLSSALPEGHPVSDELNRLKNVLSERSQTASNLIEDLHELVVELSDKPTEHSEEALNDWDAHINLFLSDLKEFGVEPSLEQFVMASSRLTGDQWADRIDIFKNAA